MTGTAWKPATERGWVAPHVAEELPGLGLTWVEADAKPARSGPAVLQRLRGLSDRFYGSHAIHLRERPIPWAYRVFFRQIGLDPDQTRTPIEQLALDRLHDGAFMTQGMPHDALTIATVETGVALRIFDAERLLGKLFIRDSGPGESLAGKSGELAHGTLVLADERGSLELLFGGKSDCDRLSGETRRVAIVAVQVNGVPEASVDEALWIASSALYLIE
jgi:DNA/RNA-binding domain of Phe-tRNA-synthetase-like protein